MKRFFTPFIYILFAFTTQAQITITQSDLPVAGNYLVQLRDTIHSAHPITAAGASAQVWDYTTNWTLKDTSTVYFQTASSVAGYTNFPAANLGSYDAATSTSTFYKNISTGFWGDGFYDPTQTPPYNIIDANPDLLLVPTPFTYGNSRTNNAKVTVDVAGSPSYRYKVTLKQTITCDAWGTISTPSVSNASVIREKTFMYEIDSIYINFGFGYILASTDGPKDTTITYSFLRKAPDMTVMTINQDWQTLQETQASYYVYAPIVPVTLVNFYGNYAGNTDVDLNWSTSTEINSANFLIERSYDCRIFTPVSVIPDSGNSSSPRYYHASDHPASTAIIYYRLKIIDRDGRFTYSNVIALRCANNAITLFPNPAHDKIELSFQSTTTGKAAMSLYSSSGVVVKDLMIPSIAGPNSIRYDVSGLSSGLYYITIHTSDGQMLTKSFIKQ
jgi:hypothetical protein